MFERYIFPGGGLIEDLRYIHLNLLAESSQERLFVNRLRFLFSMPCLLLGYGFEPRSNSHVLDTAGTVLIIGLSINGRLHSENQFDERKQD